MAKLRTVRNYRFLVCHLRHILH